MPFLSSFAQPLDDFADCMSDLSDLDRCSATPSMSSVYELSCALSPASSADSLFSSEYERTSPLSHYPMPSAQESVPTTNYSSFVQSPELVASTCSAVEEVVQRDLKPLLRKVSLGIKSLVFVFVFRSAKSNSFTSGSLPLFRFPEIFAKRLIVFFFFCFSSPLIQQALTADKCSVC